MRRGLALFLVAVGFSTEPAAAFVWPNAVNRVERDLGSAEAPVRRSAAQRLRELPGPAVRRLAPRALDDPDPDVRLAAADAALGAELPGLGDRVVSWLNEPDARLRRVAAEILRTNPSKDATPLLGRVLGDPNVEVRVAAAAALGASGDPMAVLPLLGRLDDAHPDGRIAVVEALARLSDPRSVVPLIGKIQDPNDDVRRAVATALGALGEPRAASALILALRDRAEDVRIAALDALGTLAAEEATLAIVALMEEDLRPAVQRAATLALARIPGESSLRALVQALGRDDRDEVDFVRSALTLSGARAKEPLVRCLAGQPKQALADGCALALGDIGATDAYPAIVDALRRGIATPPAALESLGAIGDPRALPTVLEHLYATDPIVRSAAIDAAARLLDPARPDGRAVEPIARALEGARGRRREMAALAALLGRTGSPRAAEVLLPLATDSDDLALRVAAIRALGLIGPAGQDRALLAAISDEQATIRFEAAVALRRSGSARTATLLLDRLEKAPAQDRAALALALSGPVSRRSDARVAERLERLLGRRTSAERDALIEALGAMAGTAGSGVLTRLARTTANPASRLKIAESLASHREALPALVALARDPDPGVRANAVWSLGSMADASTVPVLVEALSDRDVTVAGNAPAALARIAADRQSKEASKALCSAAKDARSYVRANALAGLALIGARCDAAAERRALSQDASPVVRAAAARLLARTPREAQSAADVEALARCVAEDPNGSVAVACKEAPESIVSERTEPVSIYVIPQGEADPVPGAPFALVLPNGLMRLGHADQRGLVFERRAPAGQVRLEIPAPLAE